MTRRGWRASFLGAGMAMAAASMRSVNMAFPQNLSQLPVPPHLAGLSGREGRRLRRRDALRAQRREANAANREANKRRWWQTRKKLEGANGGVQKIINKMTQQQRRAWQRAGRERDIDVVRKFAGLIA